LMVSPFFFLAGHARDRKLLQAEAQEAV
jgi:hypothetical protein